MRRRNMFELAAQALDESEKRCEIRGVGLGLGVAKTQAVLGDTDARVGCWVSRSRHNYHGSGER